MPSNNTANHGAFLDIYQVAETFINSERRALTLEFNRPQDATTFRARFHKWRKRMQDQGINDYNTIKISKEENTLTFAYHLDPKTLKPIGFKMIDPDSGEEYSPAVTNLDSEPEAAELDDDAAEFARKLGIKEDKQ